MAKKSIDEIFSLETRYTIILLADNDEKNNSSVSTVELRISQLAVVVGLYRRLAGGSFFREEGVMFHTLGTATAIHMNHNQLVFGKKCQPDVSNIWMFMSENSAQT